MQVNRRYEDRKIRRQEQKGWKRERERSRCGRKEEEGRKEDCVGKQKVGRQEDREIREDKDGKDGRENEKNLAVEY